MSETQPLTDAEIAGMMDWRGPGAYTQHTLRKIRRILDAMEREIYICGAHKPLALRRLMAYINVHGQRGAAQQPGETP